MENNERKPGESNKQYLDRIKAQKKEQKIQEDINRVKSQEDYGGELEASVVTAELPSEKRIQQLRKEYRSAKRQSRLIDQELRKYDYLIDQEKIDNLIDQISNLPNYKKIRQELKAEKDLYRSKNFLGIGDGTGNALPSQLYGWWSRHYGYQKKQQNSNDIALTNRGTDIIDLSKNVIRVTPDSEQKTALFNEFIEKKFPSIHPAEKYQNGEIDIFGDRFRVPTKNVQLYAGIEDGKFKVDSLFNFDKNSIIYPARNIRKDTPQIYGIKINEGEEGELPIDVRRKLFILNELVPGNSMESAKLTIGNRQLNPEYHNILFQRIQNDKHKYDNEKTPQGDAIKAFISGNRISPYFRGLLFNDYVYPSDDLQSLKVADDSKIKKLLQNNSKNDLKYRYVDKHGKEHPISKYNASILDNKTIFSNPSGGVFVGRIQDISDSQLDSLNNYLSKNPSWLIRPDLGSYSHYRLDSPTLKSYLGQYMEHPSSNDPNVYTVGTTEDNKLWE